MSLNFDEDYFTQGSIGFRNYHSFPHFAQRAQWIKDNLTGTILEIGCAFGFLISELNKLGITANGLDNSRYALSQAPSEIADQLALGDIVDLNTSYDWIVSWNVLDSLADRAHALSRAGALNSFSVNQLHIISMSEQRDKYTELGYFIRDAPFWRSLLPNAILVCSECRVVYNPTPFEFSQIPLHIGKGVSD